MRLFSYCIPIDDGAAPNPFHGQCTLVICKPVIRRVAENDDWIVGVGSKNVNGVNYSGKLVYAMKVTEKMKMNKYDNQCRLMKSLKIPDLESSEYVRKLGDCIYDFEDSYEGVLRPSVHTESNRKTDLGGQYALKSDHFYYFGENAVEIPSQFSILVRQGRGHQSKRNEPIKEEFIEWVIKTFEKNRLYGDPQIKLKFTSKGLTDISCAKARIEEAEEDESLPDIDTILPLSHWSYFLALEADLKTISRYVEVHSSNHGTFSIALTQLFLATCSEIDVVLRDMCEILSGKKARDMKAYKKVILKKAESMLCHQVRIPLYGMTFIPFYGITTTKSPDWWDAYNLVKHHRNLHFEKASLINCIHALGALYVSIFHLIRVHRGKTELEWATNLIYKHLQPKQELFLLQGEDTYRDVAEGKSRFSFF